MLRETVEYEDEQVTDAVRREHFSRLEEMARHGMRVESGEPLHVAACLKSRSLEFINFLVAEMGAEVNAEWEGKTALMVANSVVTVRRLIFLGADVGIVSSAGNTVLHSHASNGGFGIVKYLVEEMGASMDSVDGNSNSAWSLLTKTSVMFDRDGLTGLLQVLLVKGALAPHYLALVLPYHQRLVEEGEELRKRLPAYYDDRVAALAITSQLPADLVAIVVRLEGPPTAAHLWATGLGFLGPQTRAQTNRAVSYTRLREAAKQAGGAQWVNFVKWQREGGL
jgi:hypothetical protein